MAGDELEGLRRRIREAHAAVQRGQYDEALAVFLATLPRLEEHLGGAHPEVEELRDDVQTVREMRELHGFGRAVGYRWDPPVPSDDS